MFDTSASAAAAAFSTLRRPRLLIRAARFGLADYDRTRTLRRIFGEPTTGPALTPLLEKEAECDARRRAGDSRYSIAKHIEIMVALMDEARRVQVPQTMV